MAYTNVFRKSGISFTRKLLFFLVGAFITIPAVIIYIVITLPAIIYRWIVTKVLLKSPFSPKGIVKPVTLGFGTAYAAEFVTCVTSKSPRPSRNVIVQQTVFSGRIPIDECLEMIRKRWVESENSSSDSLKYPELRQFVVSWMGYLFWKEDPDFQLENHVRAHKPVNPSENFENYCKNLLEDLLNKPLMPCQSPWEIHIVHSCGCHWSQPKTGYRNENNNLHPIISFCSTCGKEEKTVFATRIHHCLGDGISFMFVLLQGLFGANLSQFAKTFNNQNDGKQDKQQQNKLSMSSGFKQGVAHCKAFVKLCHDLGCVASFVVWRVNSKTALHISDDRKTWRQFYERSEQFPLERMKLLKNHFGVSFSAVVLSCTSAALSKRLLRGGLNINACEQEIKNFLLCMVVPLPGHPVDQWINYITGTAYKLPLKPEMDPVQRLLACHKVMKQVNQSLFPQVVFPILVRLLCFHVTPIVRFGFYNKWFGAAISNFSVADTSDEDLICNGKYPIVNGYATSGGNDGVTGLFIQTLGFRGQFQFMGTVDEAVMQRSELQGLLQDFVQETEILLKRVKHSSETAYFANNVELNIEKN